MGLLDEQVRFLVGWFSETLPQAPIEQLALLRVDCDLYQSTLDVLDNLYAKVVPGGVVIVDDYGSYEACRQATDEFRARSAMVTEPVVPIDTEAVFWRRSR